MYYSPGVQYLCPRCGSNWVRFVFDANCKGWSESMKLIKAKKVKLLDSLEDMAVNITTPKWICRKCYDCGIVQKS
ncbi:hypothetical protein SCCGRSA3_01929 [Marine Group I thaumarchaeote SCGC RSA3]|uniref:Uncharacterized protein n=2 Tax=Marine Group I TaxID=905826 RepID=A0A081RP05_9ARCH|nr:hypothetical protein AAA799N04_00598 [Marine Group I thaumarchaeote SCGC AAA799-N04]KFM17406.1 hypothetical protein SCCGRSA3_01929 [Marine Group I thaumarchaeote SCGC RSA3]